MTSTELKKTFWETEDKLRAQMDAAGCKHLVLGLIFLNTCLSYSMSSDTGSRSSSLIPHPTFTSGKIAFSRTNLAVLAARVG